MRMFVVTLLRYESCLGRIFVIDLFSTDFGYACLDSYHFILCIFGSHHEFYKRFLFMSCFPGSLLPVISVCTLSVLRFSGKKYFCFAFYLCPCLWDPNMIWFIPEPCHSQNVGDLCMYFVLNPCFVFCFF